MKFYVTAVIVVEAPRAQAAVEAAISITSGGPHMTQDSGIVMIEGLDYEGEPILEVFVDDPRGPQLVSLGDYIIPEKP